MTVAQLIAHLQTLPQEAEVQCLSEYDCGWSTSVKWKDLEIENDISLTDLRGNQFIAPDNPNFNKIFLEIGSK